ncbi:MAG: hypothetical protein WC307_07055, partial [Candidatus Nanoarchaeia archaeon]
MVTDDKPEQEKLALIYTIHKFYNKEEGMDLIKKYLDEARREAIEKEIAYLEWLQTDYLECFTVQPQFSGETQEIISNL